MTIFLKKCCFWPFPTIGVQKKGPKKADRPCVDQRFLSILAIFKFNRKNLNKSIFGNPNLEVRTPNFRVRTPEFPIGKVALLLLIAFRVFENPYGEFRSTGFSESELQIPEYELLRINRVHPFDFLKSSDSEKIAGRLFCYGSPREGAL